MITKEEYLTAQENETLFRELAQHPKDSQLYRDLRDEIYKGNLGLVYEEIGKYRFENRYNNEELFSEAAIGLLTAIDRFDISKNVKFSTYASYWIECYIHKQLKEFYKFNEKITNSLDETFTRDDGSHYTFEERLGQVDDDIQNVPNKVDAEIVGELLDKLTVSQRAVIIERYYNGNGTNTQAEAAANLHVTTQAVNSLEKRSLNKLKTLIQEYSESQTQRDQVCKYKKFVKLLPENEKKVITLRYFSKKVYLQKDVAKLMKTSLGRIKRLETSAIGRLNQLSQQVEDV